MINLSSFIRFHATRAPDRTALVYGDARVTYGRFLDRIETTAGWLAAQGISENDVVAVLMKNSLAFVELAFAASHIGAVFLPVNFRLAAGEIAYILTNSGAKLLLADAEFAATVQSLPRVVLVDEPAQVDSTRLAHAAARAPLQVRRTEDLFRLMYTSGTTDHPKGVVHTYANFYWKCMDHVVALGLTAADRLLVTGRSITWGPSTCRGWRCCGSAACCASIASSTPNVRSPPSPARS
jgi:acyl-CoA synthetase (AMP-forming)/AMP-acid ligase II